MKEILWELFIMLVYDIFPDIFKYLNNKDWLYLRLTSKQIYGLIGKKEIRKRKGIIIIDDCEIEKFYSKLITNSSKNILVIMPNICIDYFFNLFLKKVASLEKNYDSVHYCCKANFKFSAILSDLLYIKKLATFVYQPIVLGDIIGDEYFDYIMSCLFYGDYHNLTNIVIIDKRIVGFLLNNFNIKSNLDYIYLCPSLNREYCDSLDIDWNLYRNITSEGDKILIYDTNDKKYYWNSI